MEIVSDPSDWAATTLPDLATLDSALRCQICKDFFDAPVITNCCHTFCSLCIRRALAATGQCPLCRATEQEYRLRKNTTVAEVLDAFRASREGILKAAARVVPEEKEEKEEVPVPPRKGRWKRVPATVVIADSEDDGTYELEEDAIEEVPDDGLVACPLCYRRMKEETVYTHLDTCPGPSSTPVPPPAAPSRTSRTLRSSQPSSTPIPTPEPLPKMTYHHLSDTKLRSKLRDLGIPSAGPRKLLQERHTEWVNLWNANVDSARPKTKKELLGELGTWERAHVRPQNNKTKGEGWSDVEWGTRMKGEFEDLVAKARAGTKKRKVDGERNNGGSGRMDGERGEGGVETGLPAVPHQPEMNGTMQNGQSELRSPFFVHLPVVEIVEGPSPPISQDRSPSAKRKFDTFEEPSASEQVS